MVTNGETKAVEKPLMQCSDATATSESADCLVHQLFEQQVKKHPDAVALIHKEQTLSYQELNGRANRIAHLLISLGIRPDDRVAICVEPGFEMVAGLLGILKAGGAYVPLDANTPVERLSYLLQDSAPKAVLIQERLQAKIAGAIAPERNLSVVSLDSGRPDLADQPDVNPIPARSKTRLSTASLSNGKCGEPGLTSRALAYIIYTSGSTGKPKGVMVEHRNLVNLIQWHCHTFCPTGRHRSSSVARFGFDAATWEILPPLCGGNILVLPPEEATRDPEALLDWWVSQELEISFLPTPLAEMVFANGRVNPHLRILLTGGDQLNRRPPSDAGFLVINNYGPTEATVVATSGQVTSADQKLHIGRPISNTKVYILDSNGEPVPVGVTGELHIGGAGVARGYLNRPELTAEHFIPDPFSDEADARMYKTGDLARWRSDGNIDYIGRNDLQIKIRGFRIEPGEIEAALMQCDGVLQAAVSAHKNGAADIRLVAHLVTKKGIKLSPSELREQLSERLPEYMLPAGYRFWDALPLTPNGKIDRAALGALNISERSASRYQAPVGETEIVLAQIWCDLLNLDAVSRDAHFFELGGHSLLAVRLVECLRQRGFNADIATVFKAPTLSALAAVVSERDRIRPAQPMQPNRIGWGASTVKRDRFLLVNVSQEQIDSIIARLPLGAANVQDIYPLAPLQQGVLFHHLLQDRGDVYIVRCLLSFDNRERVERFLNALQVVINRHDIFRAAVFWQGLPEPIQVVCRQAFLPIEYLPEAEGDPLLRLRQATDPRQLRMDLERPPLLRAYVAPTSSGECLLAFLFHHLICDHLTLELMLSELKSLLEGNGDVLPVPVPYGSFTGRNDQTSLDEYGHYFRRRLGDVDVPTAPFGVLDTKSCADEAQKITVPLSDELARRIRQTARGQSVSPAVLFHVAWARVLAACVGRDDVVLGTVLSGRHGSEDAQRVFGMFINTLPLRLRFGNKSIGEVVHETYESIMDLLMRQQAPLALVQRCSRVVPPLPLFTTLLNYRHNHVPPESGRGEAAIWKFEGARLIALEEHANYPITLCVDDYGDAFTLVMHSAADIDGNALLRSTIESITAIVDELAAAPSRPNAASTRYPVETTHQPRSPNGSQMDDRAASGCHESRHDPPVSYTEVAIAEIWQDLLGLSRVGRHDDFFNLGGHSLLAMQFVARVRTQLKKNIPLKLFFERPTLRRIAELIDRTATEVVPSQRRTEDNSFVAHQGADVAVRIVEGIPPGPRFGGLAKTLSVPGLITPDETPGQRPVFWAPSVGSVPRFIESRRLMALLSDECILHCFEPAPEFTTIEGLAEHCVRLMRTKQPHGPYTLIGYCQCGHIAYEMARQLESEGESIDLLAIIDCSARAFAPSMRQHYYLLREKLTAYRRQGFRNLIMRARRRAAQGVNGRMAVSISEDHRPFLAHSLAVRKHRAKRFGAQIVLFRSEESVVSLGSLTLGWEALARMVETHVIPCGHTSILAEPGVNRMAATLKEYFREMPLRRQPPAALGS